MAHGGQPWDAATATAPSPVRGDIRNRCFLSRLKVLTLYSLLCTQGLPPWASRQGDSPLTRLTLPETDLSQRLWATGLPRPGDDDGGHHDHVWVHSVCNFGGRINVCMTTQYCSVFSRNPRNWSAVALGARISKRRWMCSKPTGTSFDMPSVP